MCRGRSPGSARESAFAPIPSRRPRHVRTDSRLSSLDTIRRSLARRPSARFRWLQARSCRCASRSASRPPRRPSRKQATRIRSYEGDRVMTRLISGKGTRVAMLGAFLLLFAATSQAQAQAPPNPGAAAIGVHGHWMIEVRESDGTQVARHEFDNALMNAGRPLLLALARQNTPGYWTVLVTDAYGVGSPCGPGGCALHEPGHFAVFSGTTKLVVLNVSLDGSPIPNKLVLQGTFTATTTGQISQVESLLAACPNTAA